jgi:hypothetical protein
MRTFLILACLGLVACGERPPPSPADPMDAVVLYGIMNRQPVPTFQPFPAFTPAAPVAVSCTRMAGTVMCY